MSDPLVDASPQARPRNDLGWAIGLGLSNLALQGYLYFAFPLAHFRKYTLAAELRLQGELAPERLMDFSPLYLELSTLAARLFARPEPWLVALQLVLLSVAMGAFYLLCRRRFSRPLAILGTALLIFDHHLLIYGRILEPEAWMLALMLGLLLLLDPPAIPIEGKDENGDGDGGASSDIRPLDSQGPQLDVDSRRRRTLSILGGGVLAAACVATRPTFLPLFLALPLVWLPLGLARRKKTAVEHELPAPRAIQTFLIRAAVFLLPVFLALVWLGWRAEQATGSPGSPTMNPGTVFFEGNQPLSRGTSAQYPPGVRALLGHSVGMPDSPHEHYRQVASAARGTRQSVAETNSYWTARTVEFLADHPGHGLANLMRKLRYAVHSFAWHDLPAAKALDRILPFPSLPFSLIAALGLLGMVLEARRARRWALLYGYALLQLATLLVFYVSARQQMGLVPSFVFFSLVSLEAMVRGHRRWLLIGLAVLLTATGLLPDDAMLDQQHQVRGEDALARQLGALREQLETRPISHLQDEVVDLLTPAPWWRHGLSPAFLPQKPISLTERLAARQLAIVGDSPEATLLPLTIDLADLWLELGKYDEVVELMEPWVGSGRSLYRGSLQPSTPHFYLARAVALGGHPARAIPVLEAGLGQAPGDPFLLAELYALGALGDSGDQRDFGEQLERYFGTIDARWMLARALFAHGRVAQARVAFSAAVERLPTLRPALLGLAASLGREKRYDEGMANLRRAHRLGLEPILYRRSIVALVRGWLENPARTPADHLEAAGTLFQYGYPFEARRILDQTTPTPDLAADLARLRTRLELSLAADSASLPALPPAR